MINTSESFNYNLCTPGVYDEYTQCFIYDKYVADSIPDYLGYVDNDVEEKIVKNL